MSYRHPVRRTRKQLPTNASDSARPHATLEHRKKIQKLLKSPTGDDVTAAFLLLESLEATQADYEAVFTQPVLRGIVRELNAQTLLVTAEHLLPHPKVCRRFISEAAERFCRAREPERLQLLHGVFHQPFCFDAWHADPAKHRLALDISDGTILWDVLHRELLAAERIKIQYRYSESECNACVVHSLNGIHLAGYYHDRGEGRPGNHPNHVVQSSDDWNFPDEDGWFEVAWAVSFENMIGGLLSQVTSTWDAHDWCSGRWDKDPHVIIAMLWSWFTAECLSGKETAHLGRWLNHESTPLHKRKTLFRWTDKGTRALASYTYLLLRQRKFSNPGFSDADGAWPDGPYLPWQDSGSWGNEFEARFRRGKKKYSSYATLPDEFKHLAYYSAVAVRDAAKRIKPLTDGKPVIEGLANHSLICLALHPATPPGIVQSLADDGYGPVASAATAGRTAKSEQRSSADQMKEVVDYVIRGTGGRSRVKDVPDGTIAVAKRLSRHWMRWKKEDSLDDVDAVNTEDPRVNESRMRAISMGVAVSRGWIVPTKDGTSLMKECVAYLDAR